MGRSNTAIAGDQILHEVIYGNAALPNSAHGAAIRPKRRWDAAEAIKSLEADEPGSPLDTC